jgi:hypothetical protein
MKPSLFSFAHGITVRTRVALRRFSHDRAWRFSRFRPVSAQNDMLTLTCSRWCVGLNHAALFAIFG